MKEKQSVLIVDDEPNIRRILQVAFEKAGYGAAACEDVSSALEYLGEHEVNCVVTDVTMPGRSGYDLLRDIKKQWPATPVVIMTAFGTIPQAVQAMRDGAFEYITKPFDLDHLKRVVSAAMLDSGEAPVKKNGTKKSGKAYIAESPSMKEIFETAAQVADSKATVLITGESGVGKEVVARSLHEISSRSSRPYVAVSCAALPETLLESELFGYEKGAFTGANGSKIGRFELANQGTLFLDEIGEIPMATQVKLLRVLQEREFERLGASKPTKVDTRLVTATNRNLSQAVEEGIFRLDLLYRLQVVELHIPALRERREDIEPLALHFLAKFCAENERSLLGLSPSALSLMEGYAWPGNVRELENTIERGVVLAPAAESEFLPRLLPNAIKAAA